MTYFEKKAQVNQSKHDNFNERRNFLIYLLLLEQKLLSSKTATLYIFIHMQGVLYITEICAVIKQL